MRRIPFVLVAGGLLLAADGGLAPKGLAQTSQQPPLADPLAGQHVLRLPPAYQQTGPAGGGQQPQYQPAQYQAPQYQTPQAPSYGVQQYGPVDGANLRQVPAAPTPYGTATPQNAPYPPPRNDAPAQPAPSPYGPASRYGGGSFLGNPQQYQQPQVQTPNYGDQGQQRPGYGYAAPQGQTPGYGYAPPQVQTPSYGGQPSVQPQPPQGGNVPSDDTTASREQPPPSSGGYGPAGASPQSGSQVPSGGLSAPVTQSPLTPLQPAEPAQTPPPQLGIPNPAVPPSEAPAASQTPQMASPQQPAPAQPGTPPAGETPANTAQQPAPAGGQGTGTAAQGTAAQGTAPQGATTPGAPQGTTTPGAPQGSAQGSIQPNANAYAPAPPWPNQWLPVGTATLQALDKVNAQTQTLTVKVGQSATFGSLTIAVKSCVVRPPDQPSDAAAFVSVTDSHPDSEGFNGWLLENEPTVSIMQHPIYDLRVTGCA